MTDFSRNMALYTIFSRSLMQINCIRDLLKMVYKAIFLQNSDNFSRSLMQKNCSGDLVKNKNFSRSQMLHDAI